MRTDLRQIGTRPERPLDPTAVLGRDALAAAITRHELTHAYAPSFGQVPNGRHVGLLVEGLASVVQGPQDHAALRAEIADGNHVLPLLRALTKDDVWQASRDDQVDLAYLEGGALVLYLEERWGRKRACDFATAVSTSDLTPGGIDHACRKCLGVSRNELHEGWRSYAATL